MKPDNSANVPSVGSHDVLYGGLSRFTGVRVYESLLALETTTEPKSEFKKKPWMRESYHRRIQKKWNKRFGFVQKPCIFKTPHGFIVHPALSSQLRMLLDAAV